MRLVGAYLKEMIFFKKLDIYREILLSGILREVVAFNIENNQGDEESLIFLEKLKNDKKIQKDVW